MVKKNVTYVFTMTWCSYNSTPKLLLWQPPLIGFLRVQAHNFYLFHRAMGQHLPMAYLDHVQKCTKPYIVSPNGDISYCPHDTAHSTDDDCTGDYQHSLAAIYSF
jgi:hypothetical protein